jgi:molecular chaperone DnaK (HSP70)
LRFAHSDARQFAGVLTKYCDVEPKNISLCTSPDTGANSADRGAIASALLELSAVPADVVFFFFSGHGFRSPIDNCDYLLPADAIYGKLEFNALRLTDVVAMLEACKARCVVLLVDACRNFTRGGKTIEAEELEPIVPESLVVNGMAAFFSCQPSERSYESEGLGSGIFTRALLDAFGDSGSCRTIREFDAFLSREVPALSRQQGRPQQTPLTRVEPLTLGQATIVSNERLIALNSRFRVGAEIRSASAQSKIADEVKAITELMALDIGSSTSLCAFPSVEGAPHFVASEGGRRHIPSAILVMPDMSYRVGQSAVDLATQGGGVLLRNFKRLLVTGGLLGAHGRDFAATDLISILTGSIVRRATDALGMSVHEVLAAVPAAFGYRAREEFAQSMTRAGVQVERLISEPCAAAICAFPNAAACRSRAGPDRLDVGVLVIDVGGGTTDVAVVSAADIDGEGQLQVTSIAGDSATGGSDFDSALCLFIRERLKKMAADEGVQWDTDVECQLAAESERVKIRLSTSERADVFLSNLESPQGLVNLVTVVTRNDLETCTAHLVSRIESCINAAVGSAFSFGDDPELHGWAVIDVILLAGLGCKAWPIRKLVDRLASGREVIDRYQETAVASGLALYAGELNSQIRSLRRGMMNVLLIDSVHSSISIDCLSVDAGRSDKENSSGSFDAVLDPDPKLNRTSIELIPAGTIFPTFSTIKLFLADLEQQHIIVVHEKDCEGRIIELARISVSAVDGEQVLRLKLDVDVDSSVSLTIQSLSGRNPQTVLLCGRHSRRGRSFIESGKARSLTLEEIPPAVPRVSN